MNKYKFASETLMEIAGLAVAQTAHHILKKTFLQNSSQSVCVLVGPGNNGGDGLVAARHLKMMNYTVDLIMFKKLEGKNGIYHQLCLLNEITSSECQFFWQNNEFSGKFVEHLKSKTLIIDSIFGFPFTGDVRAPYKDFIPLLKNFEEKILSVDIPSGWDADQGNVRHLFTPKYLISLGMPKKCSEGFNGEHYFGGRFVPLSVCKELDITLPEFQEDQLFMRL